MNQINIIGNLTKDPELQTTPSGKNVCKLSIAVGRKFKRENEPDVDYFNVVAWDKLGENAAKFLAKGKKAYVSGRLQFRNYEVEGQKKQTHDIIATDIEYLTPQAQNSQGGANDGSTGAMQPVTDENLPF